MQRCHVDDDDFDDDNDGFDDDDNIDDIDDDDLQDVDHSKPVAGPWARVRGPGPRATSLTRADHTRRSREAREIGPTDLSRWASHHRRPVISERPPRIIIIITRAFLSASSQPERAHHRATWHAGSFTLAPRHVTDRREPGANENRTTTALHHPSSSHPPPG